MSNYPQREPKYSDQELINALREVDKRHPYRRMSEDIYERERDDSHPSSDSLIKRLGSWVEVRERYL